VVNELYQKINIGCLNLELIDKNATNHYQTMMKSSSPPPETLTNTITFLN